MLGMGNVIAMASFLWRGASCAGQLRRAAVGLQNDRQLDHQLGQDTSDCWIKTLQLEVTRTPCHLGI